jgi:hypothetical protein
MGEKRDAYKILVRNPEWRHWHGWEDNIKMDLKRNRV